MNIPQAVHAINAKVTEFGGKCFVVGGAVRDWVMGVEPVDFDLLVTGITAKVFMLAFPEAKQVVGNAPVFLVGDFEIALGRREVSTGNGKHGFTFVADPSITVIQDLRRRDFTINAMAFDIDTGEIIDPFGGQFDIHDRILREVSAAFMESPERVFRAASFAARFDFNLSSNLVALCQAMFADFDTIPVEQIWRHFEKGLTKAIRPSRFIRVLARTSWVRHFPELGATLTCPQDSQWHPEGSVFDHTCHVMNAAPKGDMVMQLAALVHDLGKVETTQIVDGRIVSPGHAQSDLPGQFLDRIGCPNDIKAEVLALVRCHMDHIGVVPNHRFVRRLSRRIEPASIEKLGMLVLADHSGRPPLPAEMPAEMVQILALASEMSIENEPVKPLIMGRHLIDMGHKPCKKFGQVLAQVFEAQIEGEFETVKQGIELAAKVWAET